MSDSILKQEEIAQYLADLISDVRDLKKKLKIIEKDDELGAAEEPQDSGGAIPFTAGDHLVPICKVTTLIDETTFGAVRQVPAEISEGWENDSELTGVLEIKVPPNVSLPAVDDYVGARFTGAYQKFYSGIGTISIPRYGLFGAGGGGDIQQVLVTSIAGDYVVGRTFVGTIFGDVDLLIAKPFKLRKTPFDGQTINGITYVYSSNEIARSATTGSGSLQLQVVIPTWIVGFDLLYVTRPSGGMDLTVGTSPIEYLDINVDARAWTEDFPGDL